MKAINLNKTPALIVFSLLTLFLSSSVAFASTASTDSPATEYRFAQEPDWVDSQDVPKAKSEQKDQAFSLLLIDNQVNWLDGENQSYSRMAYQVNSQQGAAYASELEITFNPEYHQLVIHHITMIRDGERIDVTRQSDIKMLNIEDGLEYKLISGYKTALVVLEDVRVGDIIDYSYTISGFNPVFGDKRFIAQNIHWNSILSKFHFRLLSDRNRQVNYQVVGDDEKVRVRKRSKHTEYVWQQKDIPAVKDDGEYPPWYMPYGFIEFSEYSSWEEVNQWAVELFNMDTPLSDELHKLNNELFNNAASKADYVKHVVEFVQNEIRYLGLELGVNSHQPNHPNLVMSRRFGDCKDKALMIQQLLAVNGIKSSPALVSSTNTSGITKRIPSPGVFNHVISMIALEDKEYWVDGTMTFQYGPLDQIAASDFGHALLIEPQAAELVEVRYNRTSPEKVALTEVVTIEDYQQPVTMEFEMEYSSWVAEAFRQGLDANGKENIVDGLLSFYGRLFQGVSWVEKPIFTEVEATNTLMVKGKISINEYLTQHNTTRSIPLYGSMLDSYVQLPEVTDRSSPLALGDNIRVEHTLEVQFPEDINMDLSGGNLKIQNDAVIYQREMEYQHRRMRVKHSYAAYSDHVALPQMQQHLKNLRAMKNAIYFSVEVSGALTQEQSELKNKMRSLLKL